MAGQYGLATNTEIPTIHQPGDRFTLSIRKSYPAQRLLRKIRALSSMRTRWDELAEPISNFTPTISSGQNVLIATSTGSNWPCSAFESLLGVALTLRGADVRFLLCDGVLPACQECDRQWLSESEFVHRGPKPLCAACYQPARSMLAPLGLPVLRYGQFLSDHDTTEATSVFDEHAMAGALRYFGRGTLPEGPVGAEIFERYRHAAGVTAAVMRRLIGEQHPDVVVFHHGIYVPQGVVGAVLREAGVRVVNWGPAYRKSTVLFSHGDTYHHTMIEEPASAWAGMAWSDNHEQRIMDYLQSRWAGGNDWINFQANAELDSRTIADRLGLNLARPVIGLLTNVIWDAQLHFRQSAFPSMLDWLFATIEHFRSRTDMQLVIRVHPAEILGSVPSRQQAKDEIARRFGSLPPHIKVVGPEEKVSTYALMALSDSTLVYGTKTALELACTGLPVVVAGEAWCRGKGFTIDVSSPEEYRQVLETLPLARRLSNEQVTAARKYAYHFFFRRMIPVRALDPNTPFGPYRVKVRSLEEMMPGADPGLDLICDGILSGKPFVYDENSE